MTRVSYPVRTVVAMVTIALGVLLAGAKPTWATPLQIRSEAAPERGGAATQPATAGSAMQEPLDLYKAIQRPEPINPEEEKLRDEEQQHALLVKKAELDVQVAEIKIQKLKLDLKRKEGLLANHSISTSEVEANKLEVALAELELRRTQVVFNSIHNSYPVTRTVRLTVYDRRQEASQDYSFRSGAPTINAFVEANFPQAKQGGWEVRWVRKTGGGHNQLNHGGWIAIRDPRLLAEHVQAEDTVNVRRDIVAVYVGDKISFSEPLHGEKVRLKALLEKAGVKVDSGDPTQYEIAGGVFRSSQLTQPQARNVRATPRDAHAPAFPNTPPRWTLGQLANGEAPDEMLEAGDTVAILK